MAIPELIETIHNRPENRNFYISNINKKTISLKPGPFVDMWDAFKKEAGFQIAN